jgi:hypothetical protein
VDSAYRNRRIATVLVSHVMQALHALASGKSKPSFFVRQRAGGRVLDNHPWTLRSDIDYYDFHSDDRF